MAEEMKQHKMLLRYVMGGAVWRMLHRQLSKGWAEAGGVCGGGSSAKHAASAVVCQGGGEQCQCVAEEMKQHEMLLRRAITSYHGLSRATTSSAITS